MYVASCQLSAIEGERSHIPFHLHSWGQRWLWGRLLLLQSTLVFTLPTGTNASNYLTFTWESLRFVAVVVAAVWDTEWVRLNYKGFARPLSHWQILGHEVTSLLSRGCRIWRRNKGNRWLLVHVRVDRWVCDMVGVVVSAWYRMIVQPWLLYYIRIWFILQLLFQLRKHLWWHEAFIFCSLWPEGILSKMLYPRWEG